MTLSITKFLKTLDDGDGPTLASQFQADLILPVALTSGSQSFSPEALSILCQSATIAGVQIATTELPVYGPPVKMPYGLVYQDLNISFICTNDMAQRILFEEWRRLIVDPTTNFVGYYDDFVGEIQISKLNQAGEITHTENYEEAFPLAIFEQELSSGQNDFLRLTIQISYRRSRTVYDYAASDIANTGDSEIPEPPGDLNSKNPNDIFRNTTVHKVPKFTP